jgi:hypothetical protein
MGKTEKVRSAARARQLGAGAKLVTFVTICEVDLRGAARRPADQRSGSLLAKVLIV